MRKRRKERRREDKTKANYLIQPNDLKMVSNLVLVRGGWGGNHSGVGGNAASLTAAMEFICVIFIPLLKINFVLVAMFDYFVLYRPCV